MVVHTRLDCVIGSSALMRLCAQLAYHHVTQQPFGNQRWTWLDFSGGKHLEIFVVNICKQHIILNHQLVGNKQIHPKKWETLNFTCAFHKLEQKRPLMEVFASYQAFLTLLALVLLYL